MALNFNDYLNRIAAMYVEVMRDLGVSITAVPRFWYWQEAFPYVTLQQTAGTINGGTIEGEAELGEEFNAYTFSVTAYFYAAAIDSNYRGVNDANLLTWMPEIMQYFNERELLQCEAFPDAPDYVIRSGITDWTGVGILPSPSAGQGNNALGTQFTHQIVANIEIEQQYL